MPWHELQVVVAAAYGIYLAALYAFREPYFVYPVLGLSLALVWQALWWVGAASIFGVGVVLLAFASAGGFRSVRRQPLLQSETESLPASVILAAGGYGLLLLVAAVGSALVS